MQQMALQLSLEICFQSREISFIVNESDVRNRLRVDKFLCKPSKVLDCDRFQITRASCFEVMQFVM